MIRSMEFMSSGFIQLNKKMLHNGTSTRGVRHCQGVINSVSVDCVRTCGDFLNKNLMSYVVKKSEKADIVWHESRYCLSWGLSWVHKRHVT